jgi:hypothetical protein
MDLSINPGKCSADFVEIQYGRLPPIVVGQAQFSVILIFNKA